MYTERQIQALSADNFNFSTFDQDKAKAAIKLKLANGQGVDRELHVAYSLSRGRPIIGKRGIEQLNTRQPLTPSSIRMWLIVPQFQKDQEETDAAA